MPHLEMGRLTSSPHPDTFHSPFRDRHQGQTNSVVWDDLVEGVVEPSQHLVQDEGFVDFGSQGGNPDQLLSAILDPPCQSSFGGPLQPLEQTDQQYQAESSDHDRQRLKPPRLVEQGQQLKPQLRRCPGPSGGTATRLDTKEIVAGREKRIEGGPSFLGIDPLIVKTIQAIAENEIRRRKKCWYRVVQFQVSAPSRQSTLYQRIKILAVDHKTID